MAVQFPHLSVRSNAPKRVIPGTDHYCGASLFRKCASLSTQVNSWRSASNYVALRDGKCRFFSKSVAVECLTTRRSRCSSWNQPVVQAIAQDQATMFLLSQYPADAGALCIGEGVIKCATIEEIEAEKSLIEEDAKERMEKTIETVRSNFNAVRTGRANPAMLDGIEVEYYGSPVSLKSIAQISTPDASSLLIQPYDKSSLKSIEKAIVSSDLDLNPSNDGEVIRLIIPQLTSERRKDMSKIVAKQAEEGKVAIRNIRRDAIKAYEKLEKEKKLSEDNVKDLSSDLQKLTDSYMKKIESLQAQKEKELLKV